jgi:hypothetical protein
MEGYEGRVEERGREDDWNILKISTFHEPSPSTLLSSAPPSQTYPKCVYYLYKTINSHHIEYTDQIDLLCKCFTIHMEIPRPKSKCLL